VKHNDNLSEAVFALTDLISKLRGPEGCPWDRVQTQDTIKMYLLEEAYEVIDAIEKGSSEDVCKELGDLLFQIFFLSELANERGEFNIEDVARKITSKMIKRHPHVFGDTEVNSASEVSVNWDKIKREERGETSPSESLEEIPDNFPALMRANRISERASKYGFDWKGKKDVWKKVQEEFRELSNTLRDEDKDQAAEELGDLLFSLVNLARHWGLDAESVLRKTNKKFLKRFSDMEQELRSKNIDPTSATIEEMDRAWERVKNLKRS
jgi:tetrapyrrole methylase family protein/MazG family protein